MLKDRIRRKLAKYAIAESLKIKVQNFRNHPPIIIYQMGKVGSATVYETLLHANLPNPIYHIHFLSYDGIKDAEEFFLSLKKPIRSAHLRRSKMLREIIDKNSKVRWKIITLVREPIGRDISDLFQSIDRYYPELIENGNIKKRQTVEFMQEKFMNYDESTNYTCTWFDNELTGVFNVDVYAHPFNLDDGYAILSEKKNVDVLLLRVEDLNRNLENALVEFLNLKGPLQIVKSNIGSDKKYAEAYRYVLDNIAIPKSVCMKIYSTKYAEHFYSEAMRSEFIQRWSKGKN